MKAKNHGGLWKVSPPVLEILTKVEFLFRHQTNGFVKKIDSELMVAEILKNSGVWLTYLNFVVITQIEIPKNCL